MTLSNTQRTASIFFISFFLCFAIPKITQALIIAPSFTIDINKVTVGGDGIFDFRVRATHGITDGIFYLDDTFSVETEEGFGGGGYFTTSVNNGSRFYITEDPVPGWELSSVDCTSFNPDDPDAGLLISPTQNGVVVIAYPYTSVNCTFTNTKLPDQPAGFSSVAFIPGVEASRLYKQGTLFENQLWEPNRNDDVRALYMDAQGSSTDSSIYTRDIIDETNTITPSVLIGLNVYKKFQGFMDGLVSSSTIFAWKALPYDWRLDPEAIVSGGVKNAVTGNISYLQPVAQGSVPFMIDEIEKLRATSLNGKVTIVTHSNGALVAKALLKKLSDMKTAGESDLIDSIDKFIMVAGPEVGTPEAISALLHGDEQTMAKGLILDKEVARGLADNMISAYNLLPTADYFNAISDPVIVFDSTAQASPFFQGYGSAVARPHFRIFSSTLFLADLSQLQVTPQCRAL